MRAYVDKDTCIGCTLCTTICPEIFSMDEDGKSKAKDIEIPKDIIDSAKGAEMQCPVSAITIQ
ncbi:ferredoxin [Petroclostridium sp. X23]|uniref:ferredoxin n=1 Tax=Petroclostridium sp. X23 TaxID=3045146 RepID=UPI0024AE7914|nr:ferredoxin [Petroclostridium sp. X23]WHH60098.1 ferredoxin [Petroclostridium sp. X23]